MAKEFDFFRGQLAPSRDKFHTVVTGNLFVLFDTNKSTLLKGHETVIDTRVVDFLVRAVRALGTGTYNLSVLGMASATGTVEGNKELAGARAYNSAMYAIRSFEKLEKVDPTLKGTTINPNVVVLGADLSQVDARLLHLRSSQIEKQQGLFRSAVFKFNAGKFNEKKPPHVIATGPEAVRRATEVLARDEPAMAPFPTPWGVLIITKGQVWNTVDAVHDDRPANKRLIVSCNWQEIVYLQGETLWGVPTADFAREIMLDGMTEGMLRAKPLVEVTKWVMSFIQGVLVGPLVMIAGNLIIFFIWAGAHQKLVINGVDAASPVFQGLKWIHDKYPTLWIKLMAKLRQEIGKEFVAALEETVTSPTNIAFFLGRVIRALIKHDLPGFLGSDAAEAASRLVKVSFGRIAFVVVEVAALVTALHLPLGLIDVTGKNLKELADSLQTSFGKNDMQIPLSDAESQMIARELLRQSETARRMQAMKKPLQDLQLLLQELVKDMK